MINMGLFKLLKCYIKRNNKLKKMNIELKKEIIKLKKERKSLKYCNSVRFAEIEACYREIEYLKKEKENG